MGIIMSPVPKIDRIHWQRLNGKPAKAVACVQIHNGDAPAYCVTVVKLENGAYASQPDLSQAAYMPGNWPWTDAVMRALVKLGAITQEDMDRHIACCQAANDQRHKSFCREWLQKAAAEFGIELTPEQKAQAGIE